jgi:hypothetical protein
MPGDSYWKVIAAARRALSHMCLLSDGNVHSSLRQVICSEVYFCSVLFCAYCMQRYVLTPDGKNCTLITDPDDTVCDDRRRCTSDDK